MCDAPNLFSHALVRTYVPMIGTYIHTYLLITSQSPPPPRARHRGGAAAAGLLQQQGGHVPLEPRDPVLLALHPEHVGGLEVNSQNGRRSGTGRRGRRDCANHVYLDLRDGSTGKLSPTLLANYNAWLASSSPT